MAESTGTRMSGRGYVLMPGHSIYDESDAAKHGLGDRLIVGQREFVYSKNGGVALAAGKMTQHSAPVANHLNLTCAAAAIGTTSITVTLGATAATLNQYADGYVHINDVTGEGQCMRIKSHPAADASATLVLTLYDPLAIAIDATSQATLTAALYNGVIIVPNAALSSAVAGVPLIAVTASYYCWLQVKGPCAVLTQGTVVIGEPVGLGGTADGACGPIAADTTDIWGRTLQVNASTEYSLIDLSLK